MANQDIVRNRLKIQSAVGNAAAFLAVQREFGSFDAYVWRFVDGAPIVSRRATMKDVPAGPSNQTRSAGTSSVEGFDSSDRPSATRSCRPWGW